VNETSVTSVVSGGAIGVAGAQVVRIENLYVGAGAPTEPEKPAGPIPPCPYPGLAYFGPEDASRFFGREQAISALVAAVARRSFTALVGASGSGKSSVVLAGLAPRLGVQDGWRSTYFRIGTEPDKNPFAALARALEALTGERRLADKLEEVQKLAEKLAAGSIKLSNVVAQCRATNPGKRILLIADQFEEVFTLVPDEALRNRFIDTLIAAFPDPGQGATPNICLVLTLRADFYNAALRYRPLADRLQGHVENLGPMTRDELGEAIVKPAEAVQVEFEPGLVNSILDDVEKRPGSLPLLQFALREMWGRLKTPLMTRADYNAIGGVEGALSQRAQAIFEMATDHGKDETTAALFRHLFTRLVTLGEGSEDTRRVVGREELGQQEWTLAQRLAGEDNRLVVTGAPTPGKETAEVVHEALIRNWPALVDWVNHDRAFISWRNQLKTRLDEWRANPTDEGTLLRGGPLAAAEEWIARQGDDLNDEESSFVASSVTRRDAEKQRAEEDLKKEQERLAEIATAQERWGRAEQERLSAVAGAQEKRAWAQRRVRRALMAVAFVIVVSGIFVWWQYNRNLELQGSLATAQDSLADSVRAVGRQQAALDEAWETGRRKQSELEAKDDKLQLEAVEMKHLHSNLQGELASVQLAQGNFDSALRFAAKGSEDDLALPPKSFSASSSKASLAAAVLQARWRLGFAAGQEAVLSAAFNPDGTRVVTASEDKTARIWDAATGMEIVVLRGHDGGVTSAAFSRDGSRIVTASSDQTARIWDAATGKEIVVLRGHDDFVSSAAFSPDGLRIVTASEDETARIWDAATGMEIVVLRGHDGGVTSAAFSRDGSRIVTASWDKTARIWDAATGKEIVVLRGHDNGVNSAAFNPDGTRVVTASWDKTARLWDAATGKEIVVLRGHDNGVNSAAFNPDGTRVVTASEGKTARIWDSHFATMPAEGLLDEVCQHRLVGISTMTRGERRLAGYPDSEPLIDVCAGMGDARR
jgi:hypothetical protein